MFQPLSNLLEVQQPSSPMSLEAEAGASLLPKGPSPPRPNTAPCSVPLNPSPKKFNYSSWFMAPAWCPGWPGGAGGRGQA